MFSQLEEKVGDVGREGFGAVPVEYSDGGTGVNNRIPKMHFGGREVKDRGDAEGDEAKGLEVSK